MARSVPYRRDVSDACNWHQDQALNSTIYILYNTGPTGFLLKEEGEQKNFKVFLGDVHNCTCQTFKKEKDLCKHICWILLKKFRVPRTNPLSWQLGLVEREINEILRGLIVKENASRTSAKKQNTNEQASNSNDANGIKQRIINEEDICPICQDDFLSKKLPVTYCRFGCGNNVHIKCMKIWADHQKTNGETELKCPLCREKFSTFELLNEEYRNNTLFKNDKQAIHHGISCSSCKANPINGKCYKCNNCRDLYLCQACFNTDVHKEHEFLFREKDNMKYRKASREHVGAIPPAIVNSLFQRDITEQDYDLLLQLDQQNKTEGFSKIPEKVIKSWQSERIREGHKLLNPGFQCRVCLRNYEIGQLVRKLPTCKHKFHADCIDNWLLHSHPTCPIDGMVAWSPEMAEEKVLKTKKNETIAKDSTEPLKLEVSSIGLMINYKTNQIDNVKNNHNVSLTNEHVTLIHRKPPKARVMSTSKLKNNGPSLEIKGQNLASNQQQNQVFRRHNSVSSESGVNFVNDMNISLNSQKLLLPKITSKQKSDEFETQNFDPFNMALVGTRPYQLSRIPNNNIETNSPNGYYLNETAPSIINNIHNNELDYFSNNTDAFICLTNEDHNRLAKQIDKISIVAPKSQVLLFNENSTNFKNSKQLGLRIHHPKTKLTRLNQIKTSSISESNNTNNNNNNNNKLTNSEIDALKLVAVPVHRMIDMDYLNENEQYYDYIDNSDENLNQNKN